MQHHHNYGGSTTPQYRVVGSGGNNNQQSHQQQQHYHNNQQQQQQQQQQYNNNNYHQHQHQHQHHHQQHTNQNRQQQGNNNFNSEGSNNNNNNSGSASGLLGSALSLQSSATLSLLEHLDKKLFIVLRDGRKFAGVLRSFDQFANIVLENTVERIFVGNKYTEKSLGIFLIRGENVVILGEIDSEKEQKFKDDKTWELVDVATINKLEKQEKEQKMEQIKLKRKLLASRGLTSVSLSGGATSFASGFGFDFHGQLFDDLS